MTVRDKLWMFGVRAGDDDNFLGRRKSMSIKWSRITPAEGAFMLDIPNMLMVGSDGIPVPFSDDAFGYMESFCRMDRVMWSAVGSAGFRAGNEEDYIVELAKKHENVCGAMLDDFVGRYPDTPEGKEQMKAELRKIRNKLDEAPRRMEIWCTLYTNQDIDDETLSMIDGITIWTWSEANLPQLPNVFEQMEKTFPGKKLLLGAYLFDYGAGNALSDESMEFQCEFALKMMKEGRADGLLFCDNCVMGVGLPSEYWLRNWIEKVKNIELP